MSEIVKKHYDEHLASFYSWMAGDFKEKVSEIKAFFEENDIYPLENGYAVDLGSGHGIQSQALTEMGFRVTAVDFSEDLLNELKQNTGGKVKTIITDITKYQYSTENKPELIVCMGDTLTHLANSGEVKELIECAVRSLAANGKMVISFRDMSQELKGTSRFIHVKSDENRILTCFLEYFKEYVNVNDILYVKNAGKWKMKVSQYPKIRLAKEKVEEYLKSSGMDIINKIDVYGMHYIIAIKIIN